MNMTKSNLGDNMYGHIASAADHSYMQHLVLVFYFVVHTALAVVILDWATAILPTSLTC